MPDVCSRCNKNTRNPGAEYCRRCLAEVIEKRVKRNLGALAAGKIVLAGNVKNSLQRSAAAYLIKRMAKPQTQIKAGKTVVVAAKCADETAEGFIRRLTADPGSFSTRSKVAATNIFESITEKELEIYANIKRIKYMKGKGSSLKRKIRELQAKYPGTIEALAMSGRQISEI